MPLVRETDEAVSCPPALGRVMKLPGPPGTSPWKAHHLPMGGRRACFSRFTDSGLSGVAARPLPAPSGRTGI